MLRRQIRSNNKYLLDEDYYIKVAAYTKLFRKFGHEIGQYVKQIFRKNDHYDFMNNFNEYSDMTRNFENAMFNNLEINCKREWHKSVFSSDLFKPSTDLSVMVTQEAIKILEKMIESMKFGLQEYDK